MEHLVEKDVDAADESSYTRIINGRRNMIKAIRKLTNRKAPMSEAERLARAVDSIIANNNRALGR